MEIETTNLILSPEGVTELFAAYAKAQDGMGDVVKAAENDGFRRNGKATRYADLAAVIEAVRPALNKNGLAVIQAPAFDGERVTIETWITHAAGGWMRSTLHLRPTKADPQGVGSAITYGRRYALLAWRASRLRMTTGTAPAAKVRVGAASSRRVSRSPWWRRKRRST